ncbi:MAG: hypothetical protein AAF675_08675 [Pseudomonadota bacterium]
MLSRNLLATAILAAAFTLGMGLRPEVAVEPATGALSLSVATQGAEAQTYRAQSRRVARRTARRTSRRQDYIRSLPAGCVLRGAYHYCGGVYYQPVVQSGTTVYIIVTP